VDGMSVFGFEPLRPGAALAAYRACGADIFHSQDTSLGTALAQLAVPRARHIVTFRDPLESSDWRLENAGSEKNWMGLLTYRLFVDNPWVSHAVRHADARFCAARFLAAKAVRKFGLSVPPTFLPTPVDIPERVDKAQRPTVVFVSRWDSRKRPERFMELARRFPQVDFIAVGGSSSPGRDASLRRLASAIPNLALPGIVDQFTSDQLSRILSASWILVNTSTREGLPNTFLEAAAHGCALLSLTDPDDFASRFGALAGEDTLEERLAWLLEQDRWRERGAAGRDFVSRDFATRQAVDRHLAIYESMVTS
jgi:glycosyltransferase involved in cell wall biosynthesis